MSPHLPIFHLFSDCRHLTLDIVADISADAASSASEPPMPLFFDYFSHAMSILIFSPSTLSFAAAAHASHYSDFSPHELLPLRRWLTPAPTRLSCITRTFSRAAIFADIISARFSLRLTLPRHAFFFLRARRQRCPRRCQRCLPLFCHSAMFRRCRR
jgi:hypothetical protein